MSARGELEAELEGAVRAVRAGEVIGIPTDTVYGIGIDPSRPDATRRLFAAKGRPEHLALPVLVATAQDAGDLAELDERARRLIASFWPGPLTLVLRRRPGVVLHLGGDETTVGLRCPGQPIARRLLERTGPLAVTSANRHGEPPATTAEALAAVLGGAVAVVVDGGTCGGAPSSVLSLVGPEPVLLRNGALSAAELEPVWSTAPPGDVG